MMSAVCLIRTEHKIYAGAKILLARMLLVARLQPIYEEFNIQLYGSNNQLIAEQCPGDCNPLFELVYDFQNTPVHDIHQHLLFLSTLTS
jgi:hypothetical protein